MQIPEGFVVRLCGCQYYHLGQNLGFLFRSCEDDRQVHVSSKKPVELPEPTPGKTYESMHPVAVSKFFEDLVAIDNDASLGVELKSLMSRVCRNNIANPRNQHFGDHYV